MSGLCRMRDLDVQVVGVPKTVDNDIAATDRCSGYPSAARYMIHATKELGADIRSLPQPVIIVETMGRNVGWIATAAALARNDPEDDASCPQLVYLPEQPFDGEDFLSRLDRIVARVGWGWSSSRRVFAILPAPSCSNPPPPRRPIHCSGP
jgi:6-phosphofructokinase